MKTWMSTIKSAVTSFALAVMERAPSSCSGGPMSLETACITSGSLP
eukprot:CAMPEP_0171237988 /NCGR_PEP_ID=MMETSP0790-20130122/43245_1 /TAXON_ID=2925 /ORGANISM="Alexandrium catenella, Strain OF101" /LENGTH=45 /DNA_ID= /DNA_START= /DNA_END= /DNA_ORIENTATION=